MATQAEQLAELQSLNAQLGLPEGDGMPLTYEQKVQELRALDEQLASTPESFGEYVERRNIEDSRSLGDKTAAFTESFMTGAGALASEGKKAISELFAGDVGTSEVGGVFQVGINDFGRFAKTLGGAAMDNFYSDEGEMQREYQRYKDNFLYNQEVRPAMLETYDEEGRDFVSFGANFVDPTLLVPGAGLIAKGGSLGAKAVATGAKAGAFAARSPRLVQLSKAMARTSRGAEKLAKGLDKASEVASIPAKLAASGTRKAIKGSAFIGSKIAGGVGKAGELTSKVAGLPRAAVTGLASKVVDPKIAGSGILGAQVTGALTGQVPGLGLLTGAEALGYLANKTGRGVERTLSALSSTGGQKRFLQRLATTADSPRFRKLALMAHAGGATKLTDLAFNSLVNGASVGALNGALAYASGEGAEGVGAAVGSGTLMGGSLPFGQPGMKGGKSQAARDQSSINFLNAKLADDQIKQFQKLSPEARLAFATVEEAGIRAPKLAFLDKQTYLDFLRQDDPNLRQAPNAHYDMGDNTIYVNQDGNAGRSSKEAMDILTHELGHHFITQGIKDDPLFARKILEQYEAKPGDESFEFAFTTDSAGSPIDSIQLNADAKKISDGYDSIQSGDQSISVGMNANKLAQEIGAEQFAMMMVDNPNIFNTIEPSLRQKLLDGSRKVLTMFGAVDPYTGNPLDISISPILKRNKQVRNLYKNYIKQREKSIVDKVDLAEKGVAIKVRKGESADQAVERMFGAQGISLKDSGAFRINNRKIREKLSQILNRLDEQPEGPMSSERNPRSDKPQSIVGKELSPELRNVFTRNDPRGTINVLINDITESIRDRIQLNFLYRSGKPSKYSDNELRARVVSPVRFKVTGILAKGPKSAASLKMDAIDEAYLRNNVEVLVKEGFAKDPNKLIEQARKVARQALDNEGKINPEGNFENELITAVFGQKESAPQIKDARLRELLAAKDSKLQHAYRSYDIDALAGIAPTGKSGIAFDWFNIKNNYSPFDDKLFMPTETFEGSPGSYFRPKSSRDTSAQVRTFKSPVQLKDGSRLSGVADNAEQSPFYGFDKNGKEFSQGREYINPQDITKSRDSDRTANQIRNELETRQKLFMPASEAGATKGKQAEAAKLWNEKGTDSPYFKKFSGGAKVVKIGEQHDFVSGEPVVVEGVHGSTHTFKEFDPSKGNPESDLGKAVYISNTPDEVGVNYAGEGPDLTGRIERKAETYMGMIEDELSSYGLSDDATQQQIEAKGYELARNELVGSGDQTYKVFAKFKNPVVVGEKFRSIDDFRNKGGKKETNFEMMFDEDAGTESGTLVDLLEQVDEVAYDFEFVDVNKVKSDIMEAADYDSIGAQELIKTMKESEGLMDTMDTDGELANGEFVRQVFEGMGFDGIIDLSVNEKFGSQRKMGQSMEGMNPDTIHYLAFKPEQIKSATGNRGTFDAGKRNILFMPAIKLYGPVENIGGIRLKNSTIGSVAVLGRGKDTKEYYKAVEIKGKKYTPNLPDDVAAKAILKNNDWEAKQLLDFVDENWHESDNAKLSRNAWQKIQKRIKAEESVSDAAEKQALKGVEQFLAKSGKDLSYIKSIQEYDTYAYGSESDGLIYRGEGKSKEPWIVDEGVEVASSESSNISNSEYPILRVRLKNGGSFFQQIRISDHDQVSARAPRDYIYDYRKESLGDALPEIVEDMQAKAWELWDDQRMDFKESPKQFMPSDPKAPTRQPANRITRQAPAMPGNRFMAPAASAGAKLSERFNR